MARQKVATKQFTVADAVLFHIDDIVSNAEAWTDKEGKLREASKGAAWRKDNLGLRIRRLIAKADSPMVGGKPTATSEQAIAIMQALVEKKLIVAKGEGNKATKSGDVRYYRPENKPSSETSAKVNAEVDDALARMQKFFGIS